jgi:hypothetical protein
MLFVPTKGAGALPDESIDVVGAAEAALILDVELQRISRWRKSGKLPPPQQELAASPVWARAVIEALAQGRTIDPPVLPELTGTSEAAKLLGVDKSQIGRWRTKPSKSGPVFPDPIVRIKAGPIWTRAAIEQFAEQRTGGESQE